MRTVLITGGSGLLGRALTAAYRDRGLRVHTAQRGTVATGDRRVRRHVLDVSDSRAVDAVVAATRPDLLVHLAAQSELGAAESDPQGAYATNVRGTENILSSLRRHVDGAALLFASSERVYDAAAGGALTEQAPLAESGTYATTKAEADRRVRAAAGEGICAAVLRSSNIYGPDDAVRSRIVPSVLASLQDREPLRLRTDGTPRHDFVFVEDAVAAYLAVGDSLLAEPNAVSGRAFNVGTGLGHSILEVAEQAARIAGEEIEIEYPDEEAGPVHADRVLDSSSLRAAVGWRPRFTLEDGLMQSITVALSPLAGVQPG